VSSMTIDYPEEVVRVEFALTRHYLGTDGPGGAGPLRYIDASEGELATALSLKHPRDSFDVLARACEGAAKTARVLAYGWHDRWPRTDSPGYLRFLVLTCATAARSDSNEQTREFGRNLAGIFGVHENFTRRTGLPFLWEQLQEWCERAHARGAAIRRFVPPVPSSNGSFPNLRTTYEVTFPTWRDLAHLRVIVQRHPEWSGIEDPRDAARRICRIIQADHRFSGAMRDAAAEYAKLYEAKASLLRLHRFWRCIRSELSGAAPTRLERKALPRIELRVGVDPGEDTEATLCVRDSRDNYRRIEGTEMDGSVDEVMRSLPGWLRQRGFEKNRSRAVAVLGGGVVPFVEAGFGTWISDDFAETAPARGLVLVFRGSERHFPPSVRFAPVGGDWFLAGPFGATELERIYEHFGFAGREVDVESGATLRLLAGVRVDTGLLGRVSTLPKVAAIGNGEATLVPAEQGQALTRLSPGAEGEWLISADEPLDGAYTLRFEEAPVAGIEPLALQRSLRFVRDAPEHATLRAPSSERWVADIEAEPGDLPTMASSEMDFGLPKVSVDKFDSIASNYDDLLEVVYAGGAKGWSEMELVAVIRQVLGSEGPSPWDVLRSLEEAGWLRSTLCTNWRARRWWLCPPALVAGRERVEPCALLRGATPTVIRARLRRTVQELGGRMISSWGVSPYCPVSCGVIGVEIGALARELAWPTESIPSGISRLDPITYLGVGTLLIVVAAVAGYVPAWRASRIDPMVALRSN